MLRFKRMFCNVNSFHRTTDGAGNPAALRSVMWRSEGHVVLSGRVIIAKSVCPFARLKAMLERTRQGRGFDFVLSTNGKGATATDHASKIIENIVRWVVPLVQRRFERPEVVDVT